jgi:hypothetical protein
MNKEIEKYIWYYLSVYIIILLIYGFFEYVAVCNGESLKCAFDGMKIKTALNLTASIFTPIIAIFAYFSWKNQKKYDLKKEFLIQFLNDINLIYSEKLIIFPKMNHLKKISYNQTIIYQFDQLKNDYREDIFVKMFVNMQTYNDIFEEKKFDLEKAYLFQHYIFFLEYLNNNLLFKYHDYIENLKKSGLEFDYNKNYTYSNLDENILSQYVSKEITEIKNFFKSKHTYLFRESLVSQSYDECIQNFETAYRQLKIEFTQKLNDI